MATESITVNVGGQPALAVAVEVEQVSGEEAPAFVATLRGLSPGDDAPINSYATDLDSYVSTIDEAQDLLDAAQGFGDVAAATALLTSGGGGVDEYASLQAVINAIAATTLAEGDRWKIAWTGDTYIADGEVIGTVRRGVPSWDKVIPATKLGLTPSVQATTGSATQDTDAQGRLRLNVTTSGADIIRCRVGLTSRPMRRVKWAIHYTHASPSSGSEYSLQALLSDGTTRVGPGIANFSGWYGSFQTTSAQGAALFSPTLAASAFATGAVVEMDHTTGPAISSAFHAASIVSGSSVYAGNFSTQITTMGDWRSTSAPIYPELQLSSTGQVASAILVGLLCEV